MTKVTVSKCVKREIKDVMESDVGRARKCLSMKNPQQNNKQSTKLKVSQNKFAKLLIVDDF